MIEEILSIGNIIYFIYLVIIAALFFYVIINLVLIKTINFIFNKNYKYIGEK